MNKYRVRILAKAGSTAFALDKEIKVFRIEISDGTIKFMDEERSLILIVPVELSIVDKIK